VEKYLLWWSNILWWRSSWPVQGGVDCSDPVNNSEGEWWRSTSCTRWREFPPVQVSLTRKKYLLVEGGEVPPVQGGVDCSDPVNNLQEECSGGEVPPGGEKFLLYKVEKFLPVVEKYLLYKVEKYLPVVEKFLL
jgi:hypothetical protein